jgi:hypothetical protein
MIWFTLWVNGKRMTSSSVKVMTFPMEKKNMFQTTNQSFFRIIAKAMIWWLSLNIA